MAYIDLNRIFTKNREKSKKIFKIFTDSKSARRADSESVKKKRILADLRLNTLSGGQIKYSKKKFSKKYPRKKKFIFLKVSARLYLIMSHYLWLIIE